MSRSLQDFALRVRRELADRVGVPRRVRARGVILMFHQIVEDDATYDSELRSGCTTTLLLETILLELRSTGWDVVSLDEAVARLADHHSGPPFAVLTFDDGYRDLLQVVPLLERYAAPFTIYIPTGALTSELYSWWLGMRTLFRSQDKVFVAAIERSFDCAAPADKLAGWLEVRNWVHEDYRRAGELEMTFRRYGISLSDVNRSYFLNPAELAKLAQHPLATIGGHSTTHAALSTQTLAEAKRELIDNRTYLQSLCGRPVDHFAFPYGNDKACSRREFRLAEELSFRTAATALDGPLLPAHAKALHSLPRFGISGAYRHHEHIRKTLGEYRNG